MVLVWFWFWFRCCSTPNRRRLNFWSRPWNWVSECLLGLQTNWRSTAEGQTPSRGNSSASCRPSVLSGRVGRAEGCLDTSHGHRAVVCICTEASALPDPSCTVGRRSLTLVMSLPVWTRTAEERIGLMNQESVQISSFPSRHWVWKKTENILAQSRTEPSRTGSDRAGPDHKQNETYQDQTSKTFLMF